MDLGLQEFVFGVLVGCCLLVMGATGISRFLHWKTERRLLRARHACRLCGHVFLEAGRQKLLVCPHCGSQNFQRRNGPLG